MKRSFMIGGGAVGAVVLVVFVISIFVLSNLDSIVRTAVEEQGSGVTQVNVSLAEADISPTSGRGALRNLTVANPKGYETDAAFKLGEVNVDIDIATITDDVIVIRAITISKPHVTYEMGGPAGNNIDAIRKNVEAFLGPAKKKSGTPDKPAKDGSADDGPKLIIRNLYVRDGKISVSATAFKGKALTTTLPDLHLKDLGKKSNGVTPGEVIDKLLSSVSEAATKSVASLDLKGMIGKGGKAVGGIVKKLSGSDNVVKTGAESVGKSLNKLFGK